MVRLLKVATPPVAATVVVPLRVPLPGLVPIASVIDAVLLGTVLPKASWAVTVMLIELPAVVVPVDGTTKNMLGAAAPTLIEFVVPVIVLVTVSVAVTVWLPAVLKVTVNVCAPLSAATNA